MIMVRAGAPGFGWKYGGVRRPALTALAVVGTTLPLATMLLMTPAQAATPTVTITWDGSRFTSTPTIASGTIVKWKNANSAPTAGSLRVSYKSGPTKFSDVTVAPGATSKGTPMTGGSKASNEGVHGRQQVSLIQTNVNDGTIHVGAKPAAPAPSNTTTKPPASHSNPPAAHSNPPKAPAAQTTPPPAAGLTNPPPLGVGAIPTPAPSAPGPGPQVAGPVPLTPAPTTLQADVPHALSQPVPARKYGLPGALAVVLLTGVVVGVVRVARSEFGNGLPTDGPPTDQQPPTE